jgi:hypothetical protein
MKTASAIVFVSLLIPAICRAEDRPIPREIHNAEPSQGTQTFDLRELWRVGGEDEEVIFGRIVDLAKGPDGNFYVLDNQLCQVMVFSPEGEHLRDLSREGEGPGELSQPMGLVFFSDDLLGVGIGYPGKVITLGLDGTPGESYYPIGAPSDGNIGIMTGVQYLDGVLVACGGRIVFGNTGVGHTDRFLAVCDAECTTSRHIVEKETPLDITGQKYEEAPDYFVESRWALGPQGRVYAAEKRDSYEISVYDNTGNLMQVFGRQYKARKRTRADKEEVSPIINVNSNPNLEVAAEDYDECISRMMFNHDDKTLWVQTPHGENEQPDGILEAWDVFSFDGDYLQQVLIPLGNEMNDGTLYLVGGGQLVVVKGTATSFNSNAESEDNFEETEVEPLEVICYEIR